MEFQGRALYNLLRFNAIEDNSPSQYQSWQVEDYRLLSSEVLFQRLKKLKVVLDEVSFQKYAMNFDSPEAFCEYLTSDEIDVEEYDRIYLLVFELWRRYRKDCRSLSIFCDELDLLMKLYDGDQEDLDDQIQSHLIELENFLDEQVDHGADSKKIFLEIASYLAHDVETFLYDFIFDLIEKGTETTASELIDDFMPYVKRPIWFEFLRIKLFSIQDLEDFHSLSRRFCEKVLEAKDFDLLIELLDLLVESGQADLFLWTFEESLKQATSAAKVEELVEMVLEFFESIDDLKRVKLIEAWYASEKVQIESKKLSSNDPILKKLKELIR